MNTDNPKPGFRWPVTAARTIGTPAEIVWKAISEPGNLERCHPFCAANPVHAWPGAKSHDEVHYLSGWVYERRFRRWIEDVGYDLEIGRKGGTRSYVWWRITPAGAACATLRITVCPHTLQHLPVALRWVPHVAYIRPQLQHYLSAVVHGIDWYCTRGEPVRPNQFGPHRWFS